MKKTLKFFGLALIAGAMMFAACGKDNESPKNDGGDNGGGTQQEEVDPTDTIPSIIVIFDEQLADLGIYDAAFDDQSSDDTIFFALVAVGKNAETGAAQPPQFQAGLNYSNKNANGWAIDYIQYTEDADHYAAMKNANPQNPAEYIYKTVDEFTFTKFETSPVELSFDAVVTMQSLYEYMVENVPEDQVTQKQLLARVKNFRFVNRKLR